MQGIAYQAVKISCLFNHQEKKMNIILAEAAEVVDRQLTLTDYRAEHIVKVLRSEPGDRLRVGLINGLRGYGTISALRKKFPFSVSLLVDLAEPPGVLPSLDLVLALPRPIMLKRVLSQVTALGVGTIHLIQRQSGGKKFLGGGTSAAAGISVAFAAWIGTGG